MLLDSFLRNAFELGDIEFLFFELFRHISIIYLMTMEYMQTFRARWKEWLAGLLLLANKLVLAAVLGSRADGNLRVYFLDVGQGDAIPIASPSPGRVLIAGGTKRTV